MNSGNGHLPYRVELSGELASAVEALRAVVRSRGLAAAFDENYDEFLRRARTSPKSAGEPFRELRALRLQLRKVVIGLLVVEYGVHHDLPLVFVRRIDWLG